MRLVKGFIAAFSMYSRIPMPQLPWKDGDMKYALCFFPWIGGVIGISLYLWGMVCRRLEVGELCRVLFSGALPLLITGGFHADGFLDTMDAFHSYQPRERKLEILKDSHIGAFAVLMFAVYGLCYLAAFSEVQSPQMYRIVCAGFFLSRCLSGIGVVTLPPARRDGLLHHTAEEAEKRAVKLSLYLQGGACAVFMMWQSPVGGFLTVLAAVLTFVCYEHRCRKELGGITGDTAGYFVLLCEAAMVVTAAGYSVWMGVMR